MGDEMLYVSWGGTGRAATVREALSRAGAAGRRMAYLAILDDSAFGDIDPAMLKLITLAIQEADRKSIPIDLCGQMSGSPIYTMLLLGLGLRRFSVTPSAIPEIKNVCRSVTIEQCRAVASRAASMENARDIKSYLKEELKRRVPELGQ